MISKPRFKSSKRDKNPADAAIKKIHYELKGRIWIEGKDGTYLGYGRIILLERIREHGSISVAAKSMNMSYRHAWDLVDSMNRQAKTPLVETIAGGKGGGGARLTERGEKAIEGFRYLYTRFKEFLQKEVSKMKL